MRHPPSFVRHWAAGGDGAFAAACSRRCLRELRSAFRTASGTPGSSTTPAEPRRVELPSLAQAGFAACIHCGWCGCLAAIPDGGCALHADRCPGFSWEKTIAGHRAIAKVRRLTDVTHLTPRALAAFLEVADLLHGSGCFPNESALVDGVMDRAVDWLT